MHEGLASLVLGPAGHSRRGRRRDDQPRHRPGRGHRRAAAHHARLHRRQRRRHPRGPSAATSGSPPRPRPHHFTLTDECLRTFDSNYKMNPPLRGREHVEAVHRRPGRRHDRRDRQRPRPARQGKEDAGARPGPVRHRGPGDLARAGHHQADRAGPPRLADAPWRKMTVNPARILGIPKGTLAIGADADVTIIDPKVRWTVDPASSARRARNTPVRRLGADRPGRGGDRRRGVKFERRGRRDGQKAAAPGSRHGV